VTLADDTRDRAIGPAAFRLRVATRLAGIAPKIEPSAHTIVFTHIGKTGGTTLDHIIRAASLTSGKRVWRPRPPRGQPVSPTEHIQELLSLDLIPHDKLVACDYLSGHFPFGIHAQAPRPCLYVTLLRHPVARLLSNIRFGLDRGKWPRDTSIAALVEQGRLIDNMQTRQIAGIADRAVPCTTKTLAAALENLRSHYAVVGVTERFDEALKGMITLLGWPDVAYSYHQVSKAPSDPDLESRVRDAAERYFAFDMELYAYASARPTPWSPSIMDGTVTGNSRQDSVLVTSPKVRFGNRAFALVPTALFDIQICPAVQRGGGEVLIV
jgi:hypothetical protein